MLGPAMISAALCGGIPYSPTHDHRPIATLPSHPFNVVDDVHRPGFNGQTFITRPVIGGVRGPGMHTYPAPGPDYYGAYLDDCRAVPVRVGHLTISVSPWVEWTKPGHQRIESARQLWLRENNYTGGVRTHVNDLHFWNDRIVGAPAFHASSLQQPEPAAIIELSPDAPRHRSRLRVDAIPQHGPARISWPPSAPAHIVAITDASGGQIVPRSTHVITAAK